MSNIKTPKRKRFYYTGMAMSILVTVVISLELTEVGWRDEFLFGLIVLSFITYIFRLLSNKKELPVFSVATQSDGFSNLLNGLFGIGFIMAAVFYSDLSNGIGLEFINYIIIGILFLISGLKKQYSLRFIAKSKELIEIEDYRLTIDATIEEIQFTPYEMKIAIKNGEVYLFKELDNNKERVSKFSNWLKSNLSQFEIEVNWID